MRRTKELFTVFTLLYLMLGVWVSAQETDVGPSNGYLIVVGGAMRDPAILNRFIQLAGGPEAPIVIIPTAGSGKHYLEAGSGAWQIPILTRGLTVNYWLCWSAEEL
jgi:cyanophycinase-like exopeptidase